MNSSEDTFSIHLWIPWNLRKQLGPIPGKFSPWGLIIHKCMLQERHLYIALALPQNAHTLVLSFEGTCLIDAKALRPGHFSPRLRLASLPGTGRKEWTGLCILLNLWSFPRIRRFSPETINSCTIQWRNTGQGSVEQEGSSR